jgi:predicted RNase H-like HicB family nuclease
MSVLEWVNEVNATCNVGESVWNPSVYRCHLAILREDDGTFSAVVLNLPGAGSCGDSEEDAVANTREAVAGVIESYLSDGQEIPWEDDYSIPEGAKQKWILVDA